MQSNIWAQIIMRLMKRVRSFSLHNQEYTHISGLTRHPHPNVTTYLMKQFKLYNAIHVPPQNMFICLL